MRVIVLLPPPPRPPLGAYSPQLLPGGRGRLSTVSVSPIVSVWSIVLPRGSSVIIVLVPLFPYPLQLLPGGRGRLSIVLVTTTVSVSPIVSVSSIVLVPLAQ